MRFPLFLCAVSIAAGQSITEMRLRVDPPVVRPSGTAVVQVQVFGKTASGREGRLRKDSWSASVTAGALSKPFRFQGADETSFADVPSSRLGRVLGEGLGQFTVKDALLFVAPDSPGKQTITVALEGVKATATVDVTAEAVALAPAESTTFPDRGDRGSDPYRALAEHYAPVIAQETWFDPKADYLARFDYDGDWRGDNNWSNLASGSSQAFVHYAAMETSTHIFLIYNFFHPRDYSDNCLLGACHENDNEGIVVAVQKDGTEFGRLQVVETLAHNTVYSYVNDASLRRGMHEIEGAAVLRDGSHPVVFIEGAGHGVYSAGDPRSLFDAPGDRFAGTGVTYVYKGVPERPRSPVDRNVGYELLPILDQWWTRARGDDASSMFGDYFIYQPFGGRPRMTEPRIPGAFLGLMHDMNKARPFWGWFDTKTRKAGVVAIGQWALDPAYSMSRNLTFPEGQRYSIEYTYNPYLDLGRPNLSMNAPDGFVPAVPIPAGGIPAPAVSASASGRQTSPLATILSGEQRDVLAGVLNRAGVGAGGSDALRQAAEVLGVRPSTGQCTVTLQAAEGAEVVVRGSSAEGATVTCNRPLPSAPVRVRVELRGGPRAPLALEQPSQANNFGVKLRFDQAGDYVLTLNW